MALAGEAGELLEIFQWKDYTKDEVLKDEKLLAKVREELADVFIYATEMAISLDLDIEEIMSIKLEKNSKKYPADAVRGNQDEYLKLKMEHRQKND
jgi:NTP pyrophosphatase (non-canonical NTP hydrolase)